MNMKVRLMPPKLASTPEAVADRRRSTPLCDGLDRVGEDQPEDPGHDRRDRARMMLFSNPSL